MKKIRLIYEQNRFIGQRAARTPGLYRGEDYALAQLLSLFRVNEQALAPLRPMLSKLKQYEAAEVLLELDALLKKVFSDCCGL